MSSPTDEEPMTNPQGMTDDELSRKFYLGGCFGLPWLWIVHSLHFYGKQRHRDAQRILREEQQIAGGIAESSSELEVDGEHAEKEKMWVTRSRNSAIVVTSAWVAWVLFVQFIFPDLLPSSWYFRSGDSYAATGW